MELVGHHLDFELEGRVEGGEDEEARAWWRWAWASPGLSGTRWYSGIMFESLVLVRSSPMLILMVWTVMGSLSASLAVMSWWR